ncbi:MAG: methyltransferase domain-containing protein [Dehalococcoidia bacterium]
MRSAGAYEDRGQDTVVTGVSSSGNYIYGPVARRVGQGMILDVGCGQGHVLARIGVEDRELHGFDISPGLSKIAKGQVEGANFLAADVLNIPFKSDTFDYLVCTEVIEHIEGNKAVRECLRVLKPGGTALMTVPNKNGAGNARHAQHVHLFSFRSFATFLEDGGFEVVRGYKLGLYVPILSHLLEVTALALRRNLPLSGPLPMEVPEFLSTNFLMECHKPAEGTTG